MLTSNKESKYCCINKMTFNKSMLHAAVYIIIMGIFAALILKYSATNLQVLLLFIMMILLFCPIYIRNVKGKLDLFEPLIIANFSFLFMFLGRPLANLIVDQSMHLGYSVLPTFDEALFLACIGVLSFEIGYFSPLGSRLFKYIPYPPKITPNTAILSAWLFTAIGSTLFILFIISQGGFEIIPYLLQGRQASNNELFLRSSGYLYNGLLMFGPASLIFFAVAIVTKRVHLFLPFFVIILPLFWLYGSRGTRSQLLPMVISIPVFWYLWKQKRPKMRTVVIAGLIGFSLLGWIREVRTIEEKDRTLDVLKSTLSSPLAAIGDLLTSPDTEMFDSMANELLIIPEFLPYMHGATITDIFIRAVPRPLFPDKPLESNDKIVNELWPEHYARSRAAPCFSLIGVFYADSGFFSVAAGMFLIGSILAAFWRWFQLHSNKIMAHLLYSMGLPFIVILMRGNIPDTLARMLFYFAPLFLLILFKRMQVKVSFFHRYDKIS